MTGSSAATPGGDPAGVVSAAAERLRAAGEKLRGRPRAVTLDALSTVLDGWRSRDSLWRRALARELPAATGFSAPVVAEGLARGLRAWSGDALREVALQELGPPGPGGDPPPTRYTGFELTSVLLAGSIPMPTLLALVLPLVLRSPVLARPAARDPVTAKLFAQSLRETDALLGRCVEVVDFPVTDSRAMEAFLAAGCVVAAGSDETIASLARGVAPWQRFVAYGHRLSIALLGPEATGPALADSAAGLALDVALWDQLGCLSPVAIFVDVSQDYGAVRRTGDALAGALEELSARLPRGEVDLRSAAMIAGERSEAEMRSAAGRDVVIHQAPDQDWTVVCEDSPSWRPAPLHRFLRVHPLASRAALGEVMRPVARHLSAAAVAGFGRSTAALTATLADLGVSRVCRPGALQSPPLGWHHDGRPLLLPLARATDVEGLG